MEVGEEMADKISVEEEEEEEEEDALGGDPSIPINNIYPFESELAQEEEEEEEETG